MFSFAWPDIFSSTNINLNSDHEATLANLRLLLLSMRNSMFGDPYFGTNLKRLMFDQNNQILRDIIIDDIYTSIITFMPQLTLKRDDIKVISNKETIYITIKATNLLDFKTDLYTINMIDIEENL